MPGTGKTTTITALIEILIENNKKVLITSYTNTAVDNILLKLEEKNIDYFRVGNLDKVKKKKKGILFDLIIFIYN